MKRVSKSWVYVLVIAAIVINAGCSSTPASAKGPAMAPADVEVAVVVQRDVPVYHEWIGSLDGMVNAAIKAQVNGYVMTQNYAEGSFVRKGQALFEIDARPFQATEDQSRGQLAQATGQLAQAKAQLAQSQAQLAQSEANQVRTQMDVDRYTPLVQQQAITRQDLDNAIQNNLSAKAQVEASKAQIETAKAQIEAAEAGVQAAKAAVESAHVNLGFTKLTSPIDGIAGQALVQVGNLVGPASGTITTVSTLEPVKANFTVSEQEYLSFSKRAGGDLSRLQLELILADGSTYPHKGKFMFADRSVNQSTGAILLIGQFPNPGNVLRPGQYAKVRAIVATKANALLVPQRAVTEMQGNYLVAVVGDDNKVSVENVKVSERVGSMWIVDEGLKPGQRVIAEGTMKARPGAQVNPKPLPQTAAANGR